MREMRTMTVAGTSKSEIKGLIINAPTLPPAPALATSISPSAGKKNTSPKMILVEENFCSRLLKNATPSIANDRGIR